jgi:ribosomal protein S18 acetylase RimI-like enzyme
LGFRPFYLHVTANRLDLPRSAAISIVSPALRARGLGGALVHALLERARAEGCREISLNVNRSNSPAVRLYSKLGFRDGARPADEADSPGSRYMERRSDADL